MSLRIHLHASETASGRGGARYTTLAQTIADKVRLIYRPFSLGVNVRIRGMHRASESDYRLALSTVSWRWRFAELVAVGNSMMIATKRRRHCKSKGDPWKMRRTNRLDSYFKRETPKSPIQSLVIRNSGFYVRSIIKRVRSFSRRSTYKLCTLSTMSVISSRIIYIK